MEQPRSGAIKHTNTQTDYSYARTTHMWHAQRDTNVSTATRTMAFQAHVRLPCARQVGHAAPAACAHCACEQGHPSGECVRT